MLHTRRAHSPRILAGLRVLYLAAAYPSFKFLTAPPRCHNLSGRNAQRGPAIVAYDAIFRRTLGEIARISCRLLSDITWEKSVSLYKLC